MSASESLSVLCGHLIVTAFAGTAPNAETAKALKEGRRAGVILFSNNVESISVVHDTCRAIVSATDPAAPPIISVDQEGGKVKRIPSPAIQLPPMRELGKLGDTALTRRAAAVVGAELAAIGFNVNFAPVLDVDSNPENPIIGDRSFGTTPETVTAHANAFAQGLQDAGVAACGKHFPGHGDTEKDSHLELPRVRHPRPRLDAVEIAPFADLSPTLASMMSAHVVFDGLDPDAPATLSREISTDLLRRTLGFEGVLFSDALEMKALADRMPVEDSAVAAVKAGCDVLLLCGAAFDDKDDYDWPDRAHEALIREAEKDRSFRDRCGEAAARSLAMRRRYPPQPAPAAQDVAGRMASAEATAVTRRLTGG